MKDDPFAGMPQHDDPDYLWISPSQDETMERCWRLWKFENGIRVPRPPKGDQDFGTILHSVAERYQLADDLGRGADGKPVDLYPEGWGATQGRTIPVWQQALIPVLIDKAIEAGVLERPVGRQVEVWLSEELIPGKAGIRGKADVLSPGEVQDHKTTGQMKYAKSEKPTSHKYLGKSRQMLDYSHFAIEKDAETVKLRHNIYLRNADKPEVRKVQATVTRAQVAANWSRLKKQAQQMLDLRAMPDEDVLEIPGPNQKNGCRQFGGCPMEGVCMGVETVEAYMTRAQLQIDHLKNPNQSTRSDAVWGMFGQSKPKTKNTMSIFDKQTPVNGAKPAVVQTAKPAAQPAAQPVAAPPTAVLDRPSMPWYHQGCPACSKNAVPGINSNGAPCRMCDIKNAKAGVPTSKDYAFEADGEGNYIVADSETGEVTEINVISEVKASEKVELPEPEPAPVEQLEVDGVAKAMNGSPLGAKAEARTAEIAEIAEVAEAPKKNKGGRPKAGFALYVNCLPMGIASVSLESIFHELAEGLAEEANVDSYFALDPFKRKDAFGALASTFNERFSKLHITARYASPGTDHGALLAALRSVVAPAKLIEGVS